MDTSGESCQSLIIYSFFSYCMSSHSVHSTIFSRIYLSIETLHLDIVAPLWPLKSRKPLISAALILLYWFSSIPALAIFSEPLVSFCTATIKITGQWKMPLGDSHCLSILKSSLHRIWMFKETTWNMRHMRTRMVGKFCFLFLTLFHSWIAVSNAVALTTFRMRII